jgi:hypothetical protein
MALQRGWCQRVKGHAMRTHRSRTLSPRNSYAQALIPSDVPLRAPLQLLCTTHHSRALLSIPMLPLLRLHLSRVSCPPRMYLPRVPCLPLLLPRVPSLVRMSPSPPHTSSPEAIPGKVDLQVSLFCPPPCLCPPPPPQPHLHRKLGSRSAATTHRAAVANMCLQARRRKRGHGCATIFGIPMPMRPASMRWSHPPTVLRTSTPNSVWRCATCVTRPYPPRGSIPTIISRST